MQLDGTLKSFLIQCQDPEEANIYIIYKSTDLHHQQQYQQLSHEYAEYGFIHFIEQTDFRHDILGLLVQHATGQPLGLFHNTLINQGHHLGFLNKHILTFNRQSYVMFLVDDNLFVGKFSLREVREAIEAHKEAIGFSLRLGTNINYCYPLNRPQTISKFVRLAKRIVKFDWTSCECDFGYPLEVSSSIYRLNELLPLLNSLSFKNPNTLEGRMATCASKFKENNPYLLCYDKSVTFCNPINIVQTVKENRVGIISAFSSESLAQKFDDGYRINVEAYNDFIPSSCHQEVELVFKKI